MMTKKQFKEVLNFLCHMKYTNKKYMMYLEVSGKDRYIMGMRNDFFYYSWGCIYANTKMGSS